jgi:hypothetical protein
MLTPISALGSDGYLSGSEFLVEEALAQRGYARAGARAVGGHRRRAN